MSVIIGLTASSSASSHCCL